MFKTFLISTIVLCATLASAQEWLTIRTDYAGGYRTRHSSGYTSHITPDYMGGWNIRANDGSRATIRSDYMGGYRIRTYNAPRR